MFKDLLLLLLILILVVVLGYLVHLRLSLYKSSIKGGDTHAPYQNILLVDVANMFIGWHMEKYGEFPQFKDYKKIVALRGECISDHYNRFVKANKAAGLGSNYVIHYVMKNHKYSHNYTIPMLDSLIKKLVKTGSVDKFSASSIKVSIAIDMSSGGKNDAHYTKGRDDYVLFHLAKKYKKLNNTIIMSNDKFRDFSDFKKIPSFELITYHGDSSGVYVNTKKIVPSKSSLGFLKDYILVKLSTIFTFKNRFKLETDKLIWNFDK